MSEKPKPKKRGRKPKNIIKTNVNKENNNEDNGKKIENNLIIRLKKKEIETSNEVESYNTLKTNIEETVEENNTSEVCWNCCHQFHDLIHGIPLKYENNIFYIYGFFCSPECCARYAHDNIHGNYSEIYTLINLYTNVLYQKKEKVKLAPNRLLLKMFGGKLSIEEYRNDNNKNTYEVNIPPILPIKHIINEHEINYSTNKNMLKLYRKKPIVSEKNSIKNSMQLIIKGSE